MASLLQHPCLGGGVCTNVCHKLLTNFCEIASLATLSNAVLLY